MAKKESESLHVLSTQEWRDWLQQNHTKKQSVWLIQYKKNSDMPSVSWSEAVDEALCFGWIDSTRRPIDEEKYMQYFGKRKANSTWSKVNKEKVEKLIADGRMTSAGLESIKIAKQNGSWSILDTVEALIIPDDLEVAFKTTPGSKDFFLSLSKSAKKNILAWLVLAKRPETRLQRIKETVESAGRKLKPKPLR
ncbi:YdeI family protein [Marinoscillum sp. 108]|uniref:YdeI/OmpD-associated family protein n=1 Tax=Marinoscillum sp. 108 TaxID=2653151 RepID=UPI001357D290|nr:YdeI/OmpD-associated family protein [Marinoscillum sp. 108]